MRRTDLGPVSKPVCFHILNQRSFEILEDRFVDIYALQIEANLSRMA